MASTTYTAPPQGAGISTRAAGGGWLVFSSILLGIAGVMRFFDALWAFRYNGVVPQNLESALFGHDLNTYGWIYLVVAALLVMSAFLVLQRSQFGRWFGVTAGVAGAISAAWWLPFYPVWSLTYIALGALVVYGLVMYGDRPEYE
jgi:hypothetical protein